MEDRGECVAEKGELARVRSVATAVAPCAASFIAPDHHHCCRTSVSHRQRELLSSLHMQDPMRRERQNYARRERRHYGWFLPLPLSPPSPSVELAVAGVTRRGGGGGHLPCCCCSHRAATITLRFLVFLNY
ncbi:uncharacterized protein LOC110271260 isoform X2 [Arachis ipaensis]|uniref:uncharacterized protein LOC110271260 isoform X1 n=1 Tax=Arachis ipaensis TaxID=130454 RepID=UPI000A2B1547|nr:uncharacterized protein LOC110271260 isoform X1 [Arachis ipaensis]XP_020977450.1 uncharacterized protein LOC110271260 isoform X2 [Arachis ipaensis]